MLVSFWVVPFRSSVALISSPSTTSSAIIASASDNVAVIVFAADVCRLCIRLHCTSPLMLQRTNIGRERAHLVIFSRNARVRGSRSHNVIIYGIVRDAPHTRTRARVLHSVFVQSYFMVKHPSWKHSPNTNHDAMR